jgi:peptidoglycan/xylan/chitin deacetylase (PgdA/CDA1 family)
MIRTRVLPPLKEALNWSGTFLLSPPHGGKSHFVNHGPRTRRAVALTFDDGPSEPCTSALIDAMAELDVRGTFFCVGTNVRWHGDLVRRMFDQGHVIGNHSERHSRKAGLRLGDDIQHFVESEDAIESVIGVRPALYRPPWGWLTPWEGRRLHARGYTIVGWDVYTLDWKWPELDGEVVARGACEETQPGSILLLHDANAGVERWDKTETVRAVQHIVPALRAEGYELVTVDELLGVPAYR